MNFKTRFTNALESVNPIAVMRRSNMRKRLLNRDMTLLIPNCAGGHIFHDLGLRFMSPTINLMMYQYDFIEFVLHLDEYLSCELQFYKHEEYDFPCAKLAPESLREISIHFTHYESEDEAKEKWYSRSNRINKENMFVCMSERDGITKEDIKRLSSLDVKGIVVFTCNNYEDIPYQCFVPKYANDNEVGNILRRRYFDDSKEYEDHFDFVGWFNEADGSPYNVSKFVKGK